MQRKAEGRDGITFPLIHKFGVRYRSEVSLPTPIEYQAECDAWRIEKFLDPGRNPNTISLFVHPVA